MKTTDPTDFKTKKYHQSTGMEKLSAIITKASGSSSAFIVALLVIVIWGITGPIFDYSDTWQLIINTGTTIVTFLMVFLIQRTQNKDSIALHLKLNELIVAVKPASNRLISVEEISENDLIVLQKFYSHLAALAQEEITIHESHSIDKANDNHRDKKAAKTTKAEKLIKSSKPKVNQTKNTKPKNT